MVEYYEPEMRRQSKRELITKNATPKLKRWERYKQLKEADAPEAEKLVADICKIANTNLKVAAAVSLLLLTGCRIQELLKYKWVWVKEQKDVEGKKIPLTYDKYKKLKSVVGVPISKPAMKLKDIEAIELNGKKWIVFKTRVEKYHDVSDNHYKYAWLLYDERGEYYHPLIKVVEEYIEANFKDVSSETELFTFSTDYLRQEIVKYLNLTPHILRNYSAKYLVRRKGFKVQDLMKWFQWRGVEQALSYSSADEETIRKNMMGEN